MHLVFFRYQVNFLQLLILVYEFVFALLSIDVIIEQYFPFSHLFSFLHNVSQPLPQQPKLFL